MVLQDTGNVLLPNGAKIETHTFQIFPASSVSNSSNTSGNSSSTSAPSDNSNLNPGIVLTNETDQGNGSQCGTNPCPINVHVANVSNNPVTVNGEIEFGSSNGTWYVDENPSSQDPILFNNVIINPGTTSNYYGSGGSYVVAPAGTHMVKIRLVDDATNPSPRVFAEGTADFTLP